MAPLLSELQDLYRFGDYGEDVAVRVKNLQEGLLALYQNANASTPQQQEQLKAGRWFEKLDSLRMRWESWQSSVLIPSLQRMIDSPMSTPGSLVTLKGWETSLAEMQDQMSTLRDTLSVVTGRNVDAARKKNPPWRCDVICWAKLAVVGVGVFYVGNWLGVWDKLFPGEQSSERYSSPPRYATRR